MIETRFYPATVRKGSLAGVKKQEILQRAPRKSPWPLRVVLDEIPKDYRVGRGKPWIIAVLVDIAMTILG